MGAIDADVADLQPAGVARSRTVAAYPASWLNRLLDLIERVPGPTWAAYGVIALLAIVAGHVALWVSELLPVGTLDPGQTFWGIYLPAQLWIIGYLDRVAREAFAAFRPLLDLDGAEAAQIEYELTIIPGWQAALIALAVLPLTLLGYALDPVGSGIVGYDPSALVARGASEWFVGSVLLVFVYHTLRQLRLVSRLHERATTIDVLQPRPLYAFSRLTSRTAIALVLLIGSGLIANPAALESAAFWTVWAPWLVGVPVLAVVIFALPLQGMHRRLAAEKDAIQAAADLRLKGILAELDEAVDRRDLARAEGLQKLMEGQLRQREVHARLPTWPWSTGTLRGFLSALALPIVVFLLQRMVATLLPT